MDNAVLWECPNCGSSEFVEVPPDKRKCAYCGSILRVPDIRGEWVVCPRCGAYHRRGMHYCPQCKASVAKLKWGRRPKIDPAVVSLLVTTLGTLFLLFIGPIVGLILAYKARDQARLTDGWSGSESMAQTAIRVGWAVLAVMILVLCLGVLLSPQPQ